MKLLVKSFLSTLLFSMILSGCSFDKDYTERNDYAIVDSFGQCTLYECAYSAKINDVTLYMTGTPKNIGQKIPVSIRTYKNGTVKYYMSYSNL